MAATHTSFLQRRYVLPSAPHGAAPDIDNAPKTRQAQPESLERSSVPTPWPPVEYGYLPTDTRHYELSPLGQKTSKPTPFPFTPSFILLTLLLVVLKNQPTANILFST